MEELLGGASQLGCWGKEQVRSLGQIVGGQKRVACASLLSLNGPDQESAASAGSPVGYSLADSSVDGLGCRQYRAKGT